MAYALEEHIVFIAFQWRYVFKGTCKCGNEVCTILQADGN